VPSGEEAPGPLAPGAVEDPTVELVAPCVPGRSSPPLVLVVESPGLLVCTAIEGTPAEPVVVLTEPAGVLALTEGALAGSGETSIETGEAFTEGAGVLAVVVFTGGAGVLTGAVGVLTGTVTGTVGVLPGTETVGVLTGGAGAGTGTVGVSSGSVSDQAGVASPPPARSAATRIAQETRRALRDFKI
jgi:hypothetical protein